MKRKKTEHFSETWFFKWILNNQAVVAFFILLLIGLTVLIFTKISPIFSPVIQFMTIIMLPLVISMLLYYLIKPLVLLVERTGLNRTMSILVIYAILGLLLVWGISTAIPSLQNQILILIRNAPSYIARANSETERWINLPILSNFHGDLESMLSDFSARMVNYAENFSSSALTWVGTFASTVARVTVAIILAPFILFYLLRDSQKMKHSFVSALPTRFRETTVRMLSDINSQLEGYVQGQVTVAIVVAIMFCIMFKIVGLRYGMTFGIMAGFLNMVPYLGSFLAMVPVVIMGLVQGPAMLIKVLIIFVIEQTIEGRFVSPLVLGNKLSIQMKDKKTMLNSEKMVASIGNQDLDHADKYFKKALREDPEEVLVELGQYLESIGFLPQAQEIYEKVRFDFPEVNVNLAQIAAEDGDIEEAFLYLDAIPEDSDDYLSALIVKADLYQMEGLTDVARDKLLEASQLSDDSLIIFGLAEMEFELGNFEQAIHYYAKLDNRDLLAMTGVSTYERIGKAYASLGKFEAAREFLEKAIEIEYDDTIAFELATLLYDQEEYQKANFYFKQIEIMSADFEGYEYFYALSLHAEHKTEEALRMAQQGISKNAFDVQLLLLASQLSYELHDTQSAESYLKQALPLAEDQDEIVLRLSTLYLEEERYEDLVALADYEVDSVLARWNIAKAYQALDDEEEAFQIYQDLATDLSENPEFLHDYAYILREFGYRDQARATAEKYLALVPDDVNMQTFLEDY